MAHTLTLERRIADLEKENAELRAASMSGQTTSSLLAQLSPMRSAFPVRHNDSPEVAAALPHDRPALFSGGRVGGHMSAIGIDDARDRADLVPAGLLSRVFDVLELALRRSEHDQGAVTETPRRHTSISPRHRVLPLSGSHSAVAPASPVANVRATSASRRSGFGSTADTGRGGGASGSAADSLVNKVSAVTARRRARASVREASESRSRPTLHSNDRVALPSSRGRTATNKGARSRSAASLARGHDAVALVPDEMDAPAHIAEGVDSRVTAAVPTLPTRRPPTSPYAHGRGASDGAERKRATADSALDTAQDALARLLAEPANARASPSESTMPHRADSLHVHTQSMAARSDTGASIMRSSDAEQIFSSHREHNIARHTTRQDSHGAVSGDHSVGRAVVEGAASAGDSAGAVATLDLFGLPAEVEYMTAEGGRSGYVNNQTSNNVGPYPSRGNAGSSSAILDALPADVRMPDVAAIIAQARARISAGSQPAWHSFTPATSGGPMAPHNWQGGAPASVSQASIDARGDASSAALTVARDDEAMRAAVAALPRRGVTVPAAASVSLGNRVNGSLGMNAVGTDARHIEAQRFDAGKTAVHSVAATSPDSGVAYAPSPNPGSPLRPPISPQFSLPARHGGESTVATGLLSSPARRSPTAFPVGSAIRMGGSSLGASMQERSSTGHAINYNARALPVDAGERGAAPADGGLVASGAALSVAAAAATRITAQTGGRTAGSGVTRIADAARLGGPPPIPSLTELLDRQQREVVTTGGSDATSDATGSRETRRGNQVPSTPAQSTGASQVAAAPRAVASAPAAAARSAKLAAVLASIHEASAHYEERVARLPQWNRA